MRRDEAVSAQEAASIMGVHFTRPARMAAAGLIETVDILVGISVSGDRLAKLYSRLQAEENYREYVESKSRVQRRPREYLDEREAVLKYLSTPGRKKIPLYDAIGTAEASKILSVSISWVSSLAITGDIVGRILWSGRAENRTWIISKASCIENRLNIERKKLLGEAVRGRPRNLS